MSRSNVTIGSLYGSTPLQGEGTLADGRHFYFRARYEMWEMLVGATADEAIGEPTWGWSEPWGDAPYAAGYMPEETAREIIESCAAMIAEGVAPPRELVGMPDDAIVALRLARFVVKDIALYHADAITAGGLGAVAAQIEEGRAVFQQRTDPRFHAVLEDELLLLDARARNELVREKWLLDEASARSVGRRWAFVAAQVDPSQRGAVIAEATRWLLAWTPEGKVREAWQAELAR